MVPVRAPGASDMSGGEILGSGGGRGGGDLRAGCLRVNLVGDLHQPHRRHPGTSSTSGTATCAGEAACHDGRHRLRDSAHAVFLGGAVEAEAGPASICAVSGTGRRRLCAV